MSALWVRWGPRLRFSSAIGADAAPICTTGVWLTRGCRRLLVALLSVRVLLLSAKQLFLAAKQLFLAAKHAVACMSLPRGRFQRELSARQPGYTLWTVIQ